MSAVEDVLSRVRISEVYTALTGITPRRAGPETWRAAATWRNGDGLNVSGDDARGVWHDFKTDEGGGVLDLVQRVRGCSRADALRWCADLAGVPLEDKPLAPEDRERWAAERRELERDLPDARCWRRAAVGLGEETLDREKSRLFGPTEGRADLSAMRDISGMLAWLQCMGDAALAELYREWRRQYPGMTCALVRWAREREQVEVRALCRYLGFPMRAAAECLKVAGGVR
ncbi:MAG: hypothetical protein ABSF25_21745 [Bryobacteraceae bacterium]|jgi:hypothetical protein